MTGVAGGVGSVIRFALDIVVVVGSCRGMSYVNGRYERATGSIDP